MPDGQYSKQQKKKKIREPIYIWYKDLSQVIQLEVVSKRYRGLIVLWSNKWNHIAQFIPDNSEGPPTHLSTNRITRNVY